MEEEYSSYREDPKWVVARERYISPDTGNHQSDLMVRLEMVRVLQSIEEKYE